MIKLSSPAPNYGKPSSRGEHMIYDAARTSRAFDDRIIGKQRSLS